ncbi:DUF262 domain-containing protein [Mesorhizobium sp. M2A.F.Ca.ET.042.01.1.1]|uniref:DUF262 domain-containing protein n=1 Tax=Mesorhizobium sp. M2A.F.Ca.ET.042.01.1.1 TaxID=2496745 RepID=UPI000FCA51FF|nr:DUF262 domain-containing protein [Mesorhizobium sp. M2A.F.Ca.ET.042.01.1.1]RUX19787.1 DUF262 domain-containing protein [Mesorhizobium sp. M2A.F.Ca.ET.042.01.1.1]
MQNHAPAASARPDIISLDVLLNDVEEGRVRVPRFQRPYVWTPQMMRELFESVLSGYPIGSLLFWAPRDLVVETMDMVGPIAIPTADLSSQISLVLDGHQRLATLFGILRLPENHPRGDTASASDSAWWLGYDLEAEQCRQFRKPEDFQNPALLPFRTVLRTADFVKFARSIDATSRYSTQDKVILLDRADRVQRAIRDYRVALTSMRDGTVDDAVAIFARVNRSGRRMSSDQMAVALTYHHGFNLEDTLDSILGALSEYGFGDVSRNVVLQSLLRGAGRNFTKPNFDDLRKSETQQALQHATDPVKQSLCEAASFLNRVIGFHTARLMPYALQLFMLSVFFLSRTSENSPPNRQIEHVLARWFWATSFEGWFASANSSEVEQAANSMEQFALSNLDEQDIKQFEARFIDRPLRPFLKTFDRRSARIRSLMLVQIARGPLIDPITGEELDGSALVADPDTRDIPYVFAPDGTKAARSPANRILLPRSHGGVVRAALEAHTDETGGLASHGIDGKARAALALGDLLAFVSAREAVLVAQEAEFLSKFGLRKSDDIAPSEYEVDIDDL